MKYSPMKAALCRSILTLCALVGLAAGSARAQSADVFLKLDGIKGDATAKGYEGTIAVRSAQMDVKTSGVSGSGGAASVGKAQFSDFVITKPIDSTSPKLLISCATGAHIKSGVISVRKAGSEEPEFLKYTFTDLLITSVSQSIAGDSSPTEQISFSYSRIEIEYKPIGADGKPGAPVKGGWDSKSNKAVSSGGTGDVVVTSAEPGGAPAAQKNAAGEPAAEPPMAPAENTGQAAAPSAKPTEPAHAGRATDGRAITRAPQISPRAGAAAAMFTQAPNAELKGRLGRLVFEYPKDAVPTSTPVEVHRAGEQKAAFSGFGSEQAELLPGTYIVSVSKKKVTDVPIAAGSNTRLHLGVLRISADANTRSDVLDSDKKTELVGGFGSQLIGLPIGTYYVRVAGQTEPVTITDGKVTEF